MAAAGSLDDLGHSARGALALVILLDQIPRNIFRGDPATWATDPLALAVAARSLVAGYDREVAPELIELFYLPFMHAEDSASQNRSVALYELLGNQDALIYARHHQNTIRRFGRFPHRNEILGRRSTPAELVFLEEDDFRG